VEIGAADDLEVYVEFGKSWTRDENLKCWIYDQDDREPWLVSWAPGSWRRSEVRLRLGGLSLVRQGHRGAQGQDWAGRMTECQLCQLMGCNKLLDTHQNMCLAGELKWMGQPDTRGKRMFQFL
jgi:hypothetical protein